MADVSNKTIVALLAIALVVTVVGTVVSVGKLNSLGGRYSSLTGAVTDSGSTYINVSGTAAISVPDNNVTIYAGYYDTSCSTGYSTIDTNNMSGVSCWINATAPTGNDVHTVQNDGSLDLSVNADITAGTNGGTTAAAILCNTGACPITSGADALISIQSQSQESNSCNTGLTVGNEPLANNTALTQVEVCSRLQAEDGNDLINTSFRVQIPKDVDQGAKSFTVTYTGTAVQ